jgi:tRNA nucleotidyltransferase/poly(A) polymerase
MEINLPLDVIQTLDTLKQAGYSGYIVGGSIRDVILGRPVKDWDFTTDATPEQILALFPDSFYDNQFGTVGIKIYEHPLEETARPLPTEGSDDGQENAKQAEDADQEKDTPIEPKVKEIYEITTFRSEQGYSDGRHPDTIAWGKTVEEDLSRRDFTMNAIAYDGSTLIDPFHGQDDIHNKLIRTVGNPIERFTEDSLRVLRAVRLAAQLGFMIDPDTRDAIIKTRDGLKRISAERIREELLKLLSTDYPSDGILLLRSTNLLSILLPELDVCFGVEQKSPKRHHIYDVGTHSVMALKFCPSPDPIVRLATLLHDIGKAQTQHIDDTGLITFFNHEVMSDRLCKKIAYRLKLSNKETDLLLTLVRWHQFSVDERQTDSAIRRIIRRVGKENMDAMLALRTGDRLGGGALETSWRLELFKKRIVEVQQQPFSVTDLKINGVDVMETYGCRPGPVIGNALDMLFGEVEEGTLINDRDALLIRLKEIQSTVPTIKSKNPVDLET